MNFDKFTSAIFDGAAEKRQFGDEYKIYELTIAEVRRLAEKLQTPSCQTELCEERVEGIKASHDVNPRFFQHKTTIVTAAVVCAETLYLVDGQHRLQFLLLHGDEVSPRTTFQVVVYNIHSDEEMRELFKDLNRDSYKNMEYINLGIDEQRLDAEVFELFDRKYGKYFARTKKKEARLYTVKGFVQSLPRTFFEEHSTAENIVGRVEAMNHLFLQKIDITSLFADETDTVQKGQIVFPLLFCNFLDFLEYPDDVVPYYQGPRQRKAISKQLRTKVWQKEFGTATVREKCPLCKEIDLHLNEPKGFDCGHIISHHNGGETELDNLRPICAICNSKMRIQNWDAYVAKMAKKFTGRKVQSSLMGFLRAGATNF
jgi:hypothetical protein